MPTKPSLWRRLRPDGCSLVPDLHYTICCNRHDWHYRTGLDFCGKPITRSEADRNLYHCMALHPKTTRLYTVLLPAIFWLGVRAFGWAFWQGN